MQEKIVGRNLRFWMPTNPKPYSLWNSGAKYISNKMPRWFQNFPVCLGNMLEKTAKDSLEVFVCYVDSGFGMPGHFSKGYDLVF